jgi:hypothetical protein
MSGSTTSPRPSDGDVRRRLQHRLGDNYQFFLNQNYLANFERLEQLITSTARGDRPKTACRSTR